MDREALLAGIKAQPDDDTARLVYADWLDENAENDCDRATAEFIRLTCDNDEKRASYRRRNVSHPQIGKWLQGRPGDAGPGWARLLPTVWAWSDRVTKAFLEGWTEHGPPMNSPRLLWLRSGRWLELRWNQIGMLDEIARVEFWRGFVRRAIFRLPETVDLFLPRILADQPLVEPEMLSGVRSYKNESVVWNGYFGPLVFAHIGGADMGDFRPNRHGGDNYTWVWYGEGHARRARWAVCKALRWRAALVLDGTLQQDPRSKDPFPIGSAT